MNVLRLVIVAALMLVMSDSNAKVCSQADGRSAEDAVDHLNTWSDIHAAFVRYTPQCDDGAVAEGFSDRIVHLLAVNWAALPVLHRLVKNDISFRRFIFRHIDPSTDTDELRAIAKQSTSQCTDSVQKLCAQLNEAALAAIKEAEQYEAAKP